MDNPTVCEIRCPIHGFIALNAWEKRLVDTPVFQRLRKVRQLAWTDFVYPGAMHTRFEHSLGVMHVATLLFDAIVKNSDDLLRKTYRYDSYGLARDRQKVRLAALLHDVGHSPLSHASEELFPIKGPEGKGSDKLLFDEWEQKKKRYKHEDYSYALIRHRLRSAIEEDECNRNYALRAEDLTDLLQGNPEAGASLLWREILDHQLDADRMDYLLRDSHHLGVNYGKYDLHRLVGSVCAYENLTRSQEQRSVRIGVLSGGLHAAESLVMARYWMFKQVYHHKTRVAFDIHLQGAMKELLPNGQFPPPEEDRLDEYLTWDDWKVQGLLASGAGGEHAKRLLNRKQYRLLYKSDDRVPISWTPERRQKAYVRETAKFKEVEARLSGFQIIVRTSSNTWYKEESSPITVVNESDLSDVRPLPEVSPIASLNAFDQQLIYVSPEDMERAKPIVLRVEAHFRAEEDKAREEERAKNRSSIAANPVSSALPEKKESVSQGIISDNKSNIQPISSQGKEGTNA